MTISEAIEEDVFGETPWAINDMVETHSKTIKSRHPREKKMTATKQLFELHSPAIKEETASPRKD